MYSLDMNTASRLVASTQDLLWERGYVGTSPKAIQQRAQAGQGSMYHHFTGKADLAATAVRLTAEQMRAQAERMLSGEGTATERISAYLHRQRDALRGCRLGGLTQDPDVVTDERLRAPIEATFHWLTRRIAEIVEDGKRAGELPADLDATRTATAIIATLQGGYVLARAANAAEPFTDAAEGILALLTHLAVPADSPPTD
jgi:TetR/AcrR family transcriptional repressor of nem operon